MEISPISGHPSNQRKGTKHEKIPKLIRKINSALGFPLQSHYLFDVIHIAENEANIANNTAGIEGNSEDIIGIALDISNNTDSIADNSIKIESNNTDMCICVLYQDRK